MWLRDSLCQLLVRRREVVGIADRGGVRLLENLIVLDVERVLVLLILRLLALRPEAVNLR